MIKYSKISVKNNKINQILKDLNITKSEIDALKKHLFLHPKLCEIRILDPFFYYFSKIEKYPKILLKIRREFQTWKLPNTISECLTYECKNCGWLIDIFNKELFKRDLVTKDCPKCNGKMILKTNLDNFFYLKKGNKKV